MPADPDFLTMPEAAVVAGVTLRDVNRVIDEKMLPEHFYTLEGGRHVHRAACPLVGFYFHSAKTLTPEERSLLIRMLSNRIGSDITRRRTTSWRPADWMINHGFLTVNLWEFAASAEDRHAKLADARQMVTETPDILGGTPVIRGTRIPVHDVAASMAAGLPPERIHAAYPGLTDRVIELAAIYAAAAPLRGRPKRSAMLTPAATMAPERRVSRRQHA